MNWDAIGAIGEVTGAVGVLVTLLYLAYQIRLNSKLLQHSVQESASQSTRDQFYLFQDSFTREAVIKAFHSDEDITLEQAVAAEAFLIGAIATFQSQYYNYKNGLMLKEEWGKIVQTIGFYFTTSWPRAWWEFGASIFEEEFADVVTQIIRKTPISGTHLGSVIERAQEIRRNRT